MVVVEVEVVAKLWEKEEKEKETNKEGIFSFFTKHFTLPWRRKRAKSLHHIIKYRISVTMSVAEVIFCGGGKRLTCNVTCLQHLCVCPSSARLVLAPLTLSHWEEEEEEDKGV